MTRAGDRHRKSDSRSDLERQAEIARQREADAERRADDTLGRAEDLEKRSREIEKAGEDIRRKATDPVGFPPPGTERKKPT